MELLGLKTIWQSITANTIEKDIVEERFVSKTIHSKSNAEVSKIKRVMLFKLVFGSLAGIMTILFAILSITNPAKVTFFNSIFSPSEYTIFFGSMALSISVMVILNYRAFRVITKFQTSSTNLKDSLARVIKVMENAMKLNIYSDALMTPIIVTWMTYAKVFSERELTLKLGVIVLVVVPLLTFSFSYFFQSYSQKLKFGNFVSRLKSYLKSLEREKNS